MCVSQTSGQLLHSTWLENHICPVLGKNWIRQICRVCLGLLHTIVLCFGNEIDGPSSGDFMMWWILQFWSLFQLYSKSSNFGFFWKCRCGGTGRMESMTRFPYGCPELQRVMWHWVVLPYLITKNLKMILSGVCTPTWQKKLSWKNTQCITLPVTLPGTVFFTQWTATRSLSWPCGNRNTVAAQFHTASSQASCTRSDHN